MLQLFGGLAILQPVALVDRPDPLVGSVEYPAALDRHATTTKLDAMPWPPVLADAWAEDIHQPIEDHGLLGVRVGLGCQLIEKIETLANEYVSPSSDRVKV